MKKTKTITRVLTLMLCALLCLSCLFSCKTGDLKKKDDTSAKAPAADTPKKDAALKIEKRDFYVNGEKKEITLAFAEESEAVPLIDIETFAGLLEDHVQKSKDSEYSLEYKFDKSTVTLTQGNGAYCTVDLEKGTVYFNDYNLFNTFSFELGTLDILDSKGFDEEGRPEYFKRVLCSEQKGKSSLIDLNEYGLPYYVEGGKGYVTLQTLSDLLLTPYEVMISYNGTDVFWVGGTLLGDLEKTYFADDAPTRTKELGELSYKQLCLLIDFHYGLKDEHGITSCDEYLTRTGLKEGLCSEDPATSFSALKTFIYSHLSDNHSNVLMHAPSNAEPDYALGATEASVGYWEFYKNYQQYTGLRNETVGENRQPYSEIGDTAFVSFDRFTSATKDYYTSSPVNGEYADEIGLISYAHSRITREGSPIKNVVIDLATNTGGHMDGGVYLAAWVLGNAVMHISDPIRSSNATFIYRADVNLDREFDERDTISDKNVYLITSPITFSCANYVAAAFKESGKVTILGTTTGGGAACVYMASTADGAAISFSSPLLMSAYKNGSYYSIDTGIAPDVKITNIPDLFNYNRLYYIIKGLN